MNTLHRGVGIHCQGLTICCRKWRSKRSFGGTQPMNALSSDPLLPEPVQIRGSDEGPLSGKTFVCKDIFDVKGFRTGFGNPTWLSTHPPAPSHAPVVQALLDAGGSLVGKAHMDEMAYSLNGENAHYGTPRNTAAAGRIPGGSSSGSAAAVAAGLADVALGTDTGGSVRVPASYCGILGFRPTHGRIPLDQTCPLAPSYDTIGWFTRDADTLQAVGGVLLPPHPHPPAPLTRLLVATDVFQLVQEATSRALYEGLAPQISVVEEVLGRPQEGRVLEGLEGALGDFDGWFRVFRITQGYEIWQQHGAWISEQQPEFGPGVRERFQMAASITAQEAADCGALRERITAHMTQLLGGCTVLAVPSAPGPAPLLNTPPEELDNWRKQLISLTCIAGLAGLPQVNLPLGIMDGLPVGLGLIAPAGCDEQLLEVTRKLMAGVGSCRVVE